MSRFPKFLILMVLATTAVSAGKASAQKQKKMQVIASAAVVREEANVGGIKIRSLPKGDVVVIISEVRGGRVDGNDLWYKVAPLSGKGGLVHSSTLGPITSARVVAASATPTPTPAPVPPATTKASGDLDGDAPESTKMPETTKGTSDTALQLYYSERKDPTTAVILELLLPMAGHVYSGKASNGIMPLAATVVGLVVMVKGSDDYYPKPGLVKVGAALFVGGRVWSVISAHNSTEAHNYALRQKYRITLSSISDGRPAIGLSIPIGN